MPIDNGSKAYEDISFVTGDSPVIIDAQGDLGREATLGYLINDGTGNIQFAISGDGINYGDLHTVKFGETIDFTGMFINKLKLVWVTDSAYRIFLT